MDADSSDELNRLVTVATGRASEALEELLRDDVRIKGLGVYRLNSPEMLLTRLHTPNQLCAVTLSVQGDEPGKISMTCARNSVARLLDQLLGRHGLVARAPGAFELDALKEAAMILAGIYLGLLGQALGLMALPSSPVVVEGAPEEVLSALVPQAKSLCVESRLIAPARQVELLLLIAAGRDRDFSHE